MLARFSKHFSKDQSGTVLVETILVLPVLTLLTFGILEFGNMMWQRQQLQIGVRDAARYMSRCRPDFHLQNCQQAAINIALTGQPGPSGNARVPGWNSGGIAIFPAVPPTNPGPNDKVTVTGTTIYQGSPVFSAVLGDNVEIGHWTQMRYLGW